MLTPRPTTTRAPAPSLSPDSSPCADSQPSIANGAISEPDRHVWLPQPNVDLTRFVVRMNVNDTARRLPQRDVEPVLSLDRPPELGEKRSRDRGVRPDPATIVVREVVARLHDPADDFPIPRNRETTHRGTTVLSEIVLRVASRRYPSGMTFARHSGIAAAALAVVVVVGCSGTKSDDGTGGASGAGGSAGSAPSCQADEKCCGNQCLRVECRENAERCACASTVALDAWMADAGVVASCAASDAGIVCCMDSYSGTCACSKDAGPYCGQEGEPVETCTRPPCASNGSEGAHCK
jgi:hypothetical protein